MTNGRTTTPPAAPKPGGLRMVLVMGLVGLTASTILVGTYRVTKPYVDANRAAYLENAVFQLLPGASSKVTFVSDDGTTLRPAESEVVSGFRLHAGYDTDSELVGVAIEARGQGFQDVLAILYAYSQECECVVGMRVLESKETPGLGDKIEKDEAFLGQLSELDAKLAGDGNRLDHRIELVKKGERTEPWQVEGITGATVSSRAVVRIIDESANVTVPIIQANLEVLQNSG